MNEHDLLDDCNACDADRGILCLDCYQSADEEWLPPTYAKYVAWAAWYPTVRKRPTRIGLVLAGAVTAACLLAAAPVTNADERLQHSISELRAQTDVVNGVSMREAGR